VLALGPNYSLAHKWYSDVLDVLGRLDEAQQESERARQLDPVSGTVFATLAARAQRRGDEAEELRLLDQTLALDPHAAASAATNHDVMTRLSSALVRDVVIKGDFARRGASELTNGIIKV